MMAPERGGPGGGPPARPRSRENGPFVRLAVVGRGRGRVHLDARAAGWEGGVRSVAAAVAGGPRDAAWVLSGGEPTLWRDLPRALEILASSGVEAGLATDGASLADARRARDLGDRGLRRVVIQLHAARADAHDWVTGVPGSARRAIAAIRACREAGLEVDGETWLTKPTAAHLAETIGVFGRLGVRTVILRRLDAQQVDEAAVLGLLPRLVPSVRWIAAAARLGRRIGVRLLASGLPPCLLAHCSASGLGAANEVWKVAGETAPPRVGAAGPGGSVPCRACEGRIDCAGAPADHVERFGAAELETLQARVRAGSLA